MTRFSSLALSAVAFSGAAGLTLWRTATPVSATPVPEQMTAERMESVLKTVRPCDGEDAFDKIAWLTTIHEAREKAAKEGKPILLWEMDGHPLGCG